ncbi:MAG: aminopeptidase [Anaerolineaceae bacterium]|nr:aminopeptidase [Anaerolineaceae bacterium]
MKDPRLNNLAKILVQYSTKVKPGDWVIITSEITGSPLMREVYQEVVLAGGHPEVFYGDDALTELRYKHFNDSQLKWISPITDLIYHKADVYISLDAASNTRALASVDPAKQTTFQLARRELSELFMDRAARKELRWVLTQFPCDAFAQEADMSLSEQEDFVFSATFADQNDPVACWQKIHDEQEKLVQWLKGKKEVVVRGPNADLTLSIEDRVFINSDGTNNMPSGEIFTGPVETSANGFIRFTYPAITGGREVEGVELEFKDGKVIRASAKKNEEFLLRMIDTDEGARFLGEFAFGTNYGIKRFTKSILFDEKIGGSIHLALGGGYPETGSKNRSSIHWDFICDMRDNSEILVDGEKFYQNGEFLLD